jgi:hypothetical protein
MTDLEFNEQINRGFITMWMNHVTSYLKPSSLWSKLWWKFAPGTTVEVKWPRGQYAIHEPVDGSIIEIETADPNDHYRPWLESVIGQQGWHWDWRIGRYENDSLYIKIIKSKEHHATFIGLKWN